MDYKERRYRRFYIHDKLSNRISFYFEWILSYGVYVSSFCSGIDVWSYNVLFVIHTISTFTIRKRSSCNFYKSVVRLWANKKKYVNILQTIYNIHTPYVYMEGGLWQEIFNISIWFLFGLFPFVCIFIYKRNILMGFQKMVGHAP